jgi:MYXO-CTERM domain-containing protein
MVLRANPTAGTGLLETDYGVVLDARVRLHLVVGATTYDWEGSVPYVPTIDFRAMASTTFDPWAWAAVSATGSTMRQHLADIPLTDAFISIPGISGGLSFDAQADLASSYHSTQITFGTDADPITATTDHVMAYFSAGPSVDYFPRLEGVLDRTITFHIFPSLYVSLLGSRWMVDLFDLPITIGPLTQPWLFDPADAHLLLPDVQRRDVVVDFGDVRVGDRAMDGVPFDSLGDVDLWVHSPTPVDGFDFPRTSATVPPHSTVTLPVDFAPTTEGPVESRVSFATNDPDTPAVYVTLRGNGVLPPDAGPVIVDAGVTDARADVVTEAGLDAGTGAMRGGCGCRTVGGGGTHGAGLALAGAALAMATWTRRRRSR